MGAWASVLTVLYTLLPTVHAIHCEAHAADHHSHGHAEAGATLHGPAAHHADGTGTTLPHDCGFCRVFSGSGVLLTPADDVAAHLDPADEPWIDVDSGRPTSAPRRDDLGRGPPSSHG